jgi:hypothetical protein
VVYRELPWFWFSQASTDRICSAPEAELKSIFARFGEVQSCIVNMDKRHAFVKMFDRKSAVAARLGMEHEKDADIIAKVRSVCCSPTCLSVTWNCWLIGTDPLGCWLWPPRVQRLYLWYQCHSYRAVD